MSGDVQASETHVIDLNIKSESNLKEIVKAEPLENEFNFFSQDPNPFLADTTPSAQSNILSAASSGGGVDPDFFLGTQSSTNSSDDIIPDITADSRTQAGFQIQARPLIS